MTSRNWDIRISLGSALALTALALLGLAGTARAAMMPSATVVKATHHDLSKPLADIRYSLSPIMQKAVGNSPLSAQRINTIRKKLIKDGLIMAPNSASVLSSIAAAPLAGARVPASDPVLQAAAPETQTGGFTAPILSFDGLGESTNPVSSESETPDTSVAVGMKYVIETAGRNLAIYNKTDGSLVLGPVDIQALWTDFGGKCERGFMQHATVVYDQLAHRWIFQAGMPFSSAYCVAISVTNDPTGYYERYEWDNIVPFGTQMGYSFLGVWPDAYYATINGVSGWPATITHEYFIAIDRSAMLQGKAAGIVVFDEPESTGAYADLPATLEGLTPPPSGEPGLFANYVSPNLFGSGQPYALALWKMRVDWNTPSNSTLTGPTDITVPAFNDMLCANQAACIPQPYPGKLLDAMSDRLMPGLDYRNFGGHETLVVNQTVTADAAGNPPSGIRWYELDTSSAGAGDWSLAQSGTYDPADGLSRWVGSIAMDHSGDMALGYSVAGTSTAPAIAYTGRLSSDAAGKMTEPETTLVSGFGVETEENSWGGHSSMTVDPANGCNFWFGNEYYQATGGYYWSTHLGVFKFGSCVPTTVSTVQGTVTSAASGQAIAGAAVAITADGIVTDSDGSGSYQMKLPAGTYSATASDFGYLPQTISLTVSASGNVTGNFALQKAPTATLSGHVTDGSGHGWGLYAEVQVGTPKNGIVADAWTDPATGAYSVTLPKGFDYTVSVTPYPDGYIVPAPVSVMLSGNEVQDFSLTADNTCAAPGYAFSSGFGEDFNGSTFPPSGWSITNAVAGSQEVWNTNTYWGDPNWTGGTGEAATLDSNVAVNRFGNPGSYDSSLVSAPIAVTSLPADPLLRFKASYAANFFLNSFEVDISVDNGAWTTVKSWGSTEQGAFMSLPGANEQVDLGPFIPASATSIRLRWRDSDPYWGDDWYAQVDDVAIGSCQPVAGGLLVGHVTDANTGTGLAYASVTDGNGDTTSTVPALATANRPAGTYMMFLKPGQYSLTATAPEYAPASASASVVNNAVITRNLDLGAGQFSATPGTLTLNAEVGMQKNEQLVIANSGSADAYFVLQPINAPAEGTAPMQAVGPFAPSPSYASGADFTGYSPVQPPLKPGSGTASVEVQAAASETAGTVVATFKSPIPFYGLGMDRQSQSVWLSSPSYDYFGGDDRDHQFLFDGTPTGKSINVVFPGAYFMADSAFDDVTGMMWQLSVDAPTKNFRLGSSHIYELDPRSGLPTGRSILVPSPQPERGLAYDPVSNTWYAGDYNSGAIYHFNASGKLLDSKLVGLPILGLAYNPGTGHLFVLVAYGAHAVYVLDAKHGYAPVGAFDIKGYNSSSAGAGLGYTCDGNLWISDSADSEAIEVASGETGWCAIRHIPWLSLAPAGATVAKGGSAAVTVSIDGTGEKPFTTSTAQLRLVGDTPYGVKTIPVKVTWTPQPVALVTTVKANPNPVVEGNYLTFDAAVKNASAQGDGAATDVTVSFTVPGDLEYVHQQGDGCAESGGVVTCDLGNIAQGGEAHADIVTQAVKADGGYYQTTFSASSLEPQDGQYAGRNQEVVTGAISSTGGSIGGSGSAGSGHGGGAAGLGGLSIAGLLCLAVAAALRGKRANARDISRKPGNRENAVSLESMKSGVAVAAVVVAMLFAATGPSTAQARQLSHGKSLSRQQSGLTMKDLSNVKRNINAAPQLVKLPPQANVSLLKKSTVLGKHAVNSTLKLTVSLKLRHVRQLRRFLQQLQYPVSPEYHHFITSAEFTAEYGPTRAQVALVENFLKNHGIKVTGVSSNRLLIHTEATTGTYQDAFNIRVKDFRLNGRTFFASEDRPMLPAAVAGVVGNVVGLDNAVVLHPYHRVKELDLASRQAAPSAAPVPSSSYLEPDEVAKAYDWPSITNAQEGSGVRVAIITAASHGLSSADYDTFWNDLGLPTHTVNVISVGVDQGQTSGMIETLLDMEWSGAMAPGATEDVYIAGNPSLGTIIDAYNKCVTDDVDQVMTTSWGAPEIDWSSLAQTADQIFMQAAAEGISMFAAAGDNGSSDGTSQNDVADYPASDPYITSANGTDLTASLAGSYISETAWSKTGGAISQIFSEPTWQTGPGVPANGWRNDSDMAMNAGPLRPYVVYDRSYGGWLEVYGTSAVAPQLAALFADGVWQNGGNSLGQSNELIYGDVNAGNYATDFHDVTTGSNGAFDAGPNWDHPTGWGSPRGKNLLSHLGMQGPVGTLQGTVTNAASGATISGATVTVTPGHFRSSTDGNGHYSLLLAAGNYTVTVKDFGYQIASASVSVTDNNTTSQDISLQPADMATISGKVTDGSGQGYGLYADIKITNPQFGEVADVWTNPKNGSYSVKLPEGFDYKFTAMASFDGYNTGSLDISNLSADATHNISLAISSSCTAPGYQDVQGFGEDFNNSFPPPGWSAVTGPSASPLSWLQSGVIQFGGQYLPNYTGGSGPGAMAHIGSNPMWAGPYDAQLVSPVIQVSSLPPDPALNFLLNYQKETSNDFLNVDINVDGQGWTTMAHFTQSVGPYYAYGGVDYSVNLAGYIPSGATSFQLRWRYYNQVNNFGFYAEIDDVSIGACEKIPGGIVYGQVSDANTGSGIVGATVSNDAGDQVATLDNPNDSNLPLGSYVMFAPAGQRGMTVSDYGYANGSANLNITAGTATMQDFSLKAGRLTANPGSLTVHATVNNQTNATLDFSNTGTVPANYEVLTIDAPASTAGTPAYFTGFSALSRPAKRVGTLAGLADKTVPPGDAESITPAVTGGTAPGAIVAVVNTGIPTWGLGVDRSENALWIGSPSQRVGGDDQDHQYLFDGTSTGDAINVAIPGTFTMDDMAYDSNTGNLWQISENPQTQVSCIYELDPKLMVWTGRKICPNFGRTMQALAYDPVKNIWIAGNTGSGTVVGFNGQGQILGSASLHVPIVGLAFNPTTQHLFVLTAVNGSAIYVFNAANGFIDDPTILDIPGYNPANGGMGLDYDCDGHLWVSDSLEEKALEVNSGETGWCAYEHIPWLSIAPATGTLATGASAQIGLNIDGTGQKPFTTSRVQLRIKGTTPYAEQTIPVTVDWDPQPVALRTTVTANPNPVTKNNYLTFDAAVKNVSVAGDGGATQVAISFQVPTDLEYVHQQGDGCSEQAGTVTCLLGDIAQGGEKDAMIVMQVVSTEGGYYETTFTASGREPQNQQYATSNSEIVTGAIEGGVATGGAGTSGTSGGGIGGLGWLTLAVLLGLAGAIRRRRA